MCAKILKIQKAIYFREKKAKDFINYNKCTTLVGQGDVDNGNSMFIGCRE